jgi:rSAM/selenodomain-associated transferase 2
MFLSIIIPTYNEADNIAKTVSHLQENLTNTQYEIIVSDGGSTDKTIEIANSLDIKTLISPIKGRAGQMNFGVANAIGDVLYFVHADSLPTPTFYADIQSTLAEGYDCGSFRTVFDSDSFMLKINAFFTRFNYLFLRGGDQTIFVSRTLWQQVGAFKEQMLIMEDYDFLERIWTVGRFKLIPKATLISARKYEENSWLTVQLANLKVVRMYRNGASQVDMIATYKTMLSYRKNAF